MSARPENTPAHRRVALALLVGLALAVSACGGSDGSVSALLSDSLHPARRVHSGRVALTAAFLPPPGSRATPRMQRLAGAFVAQGPGRLPRFRLVLGGAPARSAALMLIFTAGTLYVSLGDRAYAAPPALIGQLAAAYAGAARSGTGPRSTAIDPRRWLASPRRVADARVDGVPTAHVTSPVAVGALLADLGKLPVAVSPLALLGGPPAGAAPAPAIGSGTVDVYTGRHDHVLRELTVRLALGATAGALRPNGVLSLTLALSDVNRPQVIAAPAHPRPLPGPLAALRSAGR